MKTFRGRITRLEGEEYIIEDSDSDADSEVGGVYDSEDFEVLLGPRLDLLLEESSSDSEPSSGDEWTPGPAGPSHHHQGGEVAEGEENVSLEGFFAFGGAIRRRVTRSRGTRNANNNNNTEEDLEEEGVVGGVGVSTAAAQSLRAGHASLEDFLRAAIMRAREEEGRDPQDHDEGSSDDEEEEEPRPRPPTPRPNSPIPNMFYNGVDTPRMEPSTSSGFLPGATPETHITLTFVRRGGMGTSIEPVTERGKAPIVKESGSGGCDNDNVVIGAVAASESGESDGGRSHTEAEDNEHEEETCNPMVSDVEEFEENDEALRGDRIGSTTYSERHVLKILMKWVQVLPKYSEEGIKKGEEEEKVDLDKRRFLEPEFEEEMSLLWDMSYEPDVMNFLVQHNAFNIISETLEISACHRLTEMGLGIMANIISQQSIIEDFSIHDASLKLVEAVVNCGIKMPRVPVLIQVFAVLRRITWFLRNVAIVPAWKELLLNQDFLNCTNFILTSSTNALLLGNVIITLFSLLEALSPDSSEPEAEDNETEKEPPPSNFFGTALEPRKDYPNYEPFCKSPNFLPSLCEGLAELMKNPKPRKVQKLTSTRDRDQGGNTTNQGDDELDDLEPPIPDGHVQTAILNGLSCFIYLYKTPNGKLLIRENSPPIFSFLINLLTKFPLCTDALADRSSTLDYFALSLNLLAFCHKQKEVLSTEGLSVPLVTASTLMDEEEEDEQLKTVQEKNGVSHSSKTFISLILHEYWASLSDKFGLEGITQFKVEEANAKPKVKLLFDTVQALVDAVAKN